MSNQQFNAQTKVIQDNTYFQYAENVYKVYESPVNVNDRESLIQDFAKFVHNNSKVLAHAYDGDPLYGCLDLLHNASMAYAKALSE